MKTIYALTNKYSFTKDSFGSYFDRYLVQQPQGDECAFGDDSDYTDDEEENKDEMKENVENSNESNENTPNASQQNM